MLHLIKIQPSKKLNYFAVCIYTGAACTLVINTLPWYCNLILGLLLLYSAKRYFQKYIFLIHPCAITALWKPAATFWCLRLANNEVLNATLLKMSLVSHFLLVLRFETEENIRLVTLLTPESIGLQDYRRLLVHLYHSR